MDVLREVGIPMDGTPRRLEKMTMACLAVGDIKTNLMEAKSSDDKLFLTTRKIIVFENGAGDLELDTVIGKNHKGDLLTVNDRTTGTCWLALLDGKESGQPTKAMADMPDSVKGLLHTATADNGKEFAGHKETAGKPGIDVYFARPCLSWEHGFNENMNGLVRQYIPKGGFVRQTDE